MTRALFAFVVLASACYTDPPKPQMPQRHDPQLAAQLTQTAQVAAGTGDCATVHALEDLVRSTDLAVYQSAFVTDPSIQRCRFGMPPAIAPVAERQGLSNRRQIAIASGAGGAVAAGFGLYFLHKANQDFDQARTNGCTPDLTACTEQGLVFIDLGNSQQRLTTGFFAASAVLGGAAIILWFTEPKPGWQVAPVAGADHAGVMLRARF